MKLLKLLFLSAILLSACNNDSTDTPETGEPKQIIVEMASNDFTDVSGTYTLENNKEYCTREDGKYKYNPQIEMFAHFKTKSSFHKTKGII